MPSPRIAAVFATMNRAATAVACVRALAAQTRPPDLVVVADNVSTDGTLAELEALVALPFELTVHRMAENRGNAGGVEEAMAVASASGAGAFWILDDDSWPRPCALAALLARGLRDDQVCHPLQIDPGSGHITWPVPLRDQEGAWRLVKQVDDLPPGEAWESRPSWTGALIPKSVVDRVGPVNGDLFIRGEDDEYSFRIAQSGVRYVVVRDAVLDHPGPARLEHLRVFGKNFFWERGLAEWKMYYQVRNAIWLKRRLVGLPAAIAVTVAYAVISVLYETWSIGRFRTLWMAYRDGWRGRLGAGGGN
jgi:rhamnopyranosyl-N-acetylglucosaminyl-diphospho-decaprenol beta-1,3/1,4-galactofuranosyltransferase